MNCLNVRESACCEVHLSCIYKCDIIQHKATKGTFEQKWSMCSQYKRYRDALILIVPVLENLDCQTCPTTLAP